MIHKDHVRLLREGVPAPGGAWADFGSGTGAFTLALADLLGPGAVIYSVDRDGSALAEQERAMKARFPQVAVHYVAADFTRALPQLPPLDGIVIANALHFLPDAAKPAMLGRLRGYLRPGGRVLLVEYNTDHGNPWVPHPLSYGTWQELARRGGFTETRLLATQPSRFLHEIFSAVSC